MLMFCNILLMSGDIKGLLCCPVMLKLNKFIPTLKSDISMFLLGVIAFEITSHFAYFEKDIFERLGIYRTIQNRRKNSFLEYGR